jgi:hypothetical protein
MSDGSVYTLRAVSVNSGAISAENHANGGLPVRIVLPL